MLAHTGRGPPADDDDETVSAFVRTNSGLSAKGDPDMWPAGASAASTAAAASSHLCSGPEFHQRMAHMSACHPLFHFIFDRSGALLAANHAAMASLRDRLGERPSYNLEQYLSLGECTDEASSSQGSPYKEAMHAIFERKAPVHRLSQKRWSRRHPGKCRWVLHEMWPITDAVTGHPAVMLTEQNISEVKAHEEQLKRHTERLQDELREVRAKESSVQPDAGHSGIQIDTPAEQAVQVLERLLAGSQVDMKELAELRNTLVTVRDMHRPINLGEQLEEKSGAAGAAMDQDVKSSLVQMLGNASYDEYPLDEGRRRASVDVHSGQFLYMFPQEGAPPAQVARMLTLSASLPTEAERVLRTADEWRFDAFALEAASDGRPLSMLAFYLLKRSGLVQSMSLDEAKLAAFLLRIEDGYPNNPYHNRTHAADVLQSMHVLLVHGGLREGCACADYALLAAYMAAVVHDFEHLGVNNDYLMRCCHVLATIYNDKSPAEMHHLAAAFHLLQQDEYKFNAAMPPKSKELLRKLVIDLVLATDMKQHFAILSMFQTKMSGSGRAMSAASSTASLSRSSTAELDSPLPSTGTATSTRPLDDDSAVLVMQVALKCADLGHLSSPRPVHKMWVQRLEDEFFAQGDAERANQLPVSPLMDRTKMGITKSQIGFFDIVALPLFQSFAQALPQATPMLDAVKDNYNMWKDEMMAAAQGEQH